MTAQFTEFDRRMMRRALELAALGRYSAPPNPRVGCVIVQGEQIVGEGWHRKSGEAHAEPIALQAAGEAARGATAYVSLEPHSYQSRTPPCTRALIDAGVKRVVSATLDPNPAVHGAGVKQLLDAGVQAESGLLEAEARELNAGFEKRMTTGLPRVVVKIGASLDGRVALANGESRWITGETARADVQKLRAESGAVLTGIETLLADDPQLTVRDPDLDLRGRVPLRVVLDSKLRTPATARLFQDPGQVIVFAAEDAPRRVEIEQRARVVPVAKTIAGRLDLARVLVELGRLQCNDVLIEAGPTLAGAFIEAGWVDELIVYMAPVLLGPDARPMLRLPRLERLADRVQFALQRTEAMGPDVKLVLRPQLRSQ
ncbi:MAG TPA: bifunctional diaminohydroxyphosphoribosylaminopyrimidine deaminase/5-amino-6-(5-phosphoribosylamino)uracil reductase RibD [Povalibacter sp.]|uniref:bifunctional diaminohydroxyphosphoribosylaminopyrimidine deaminase/5-amino-6-(5-phosphoribosylamino)uracil reductase RibD n=1 Tax=Povalibacter sp. TaxID=1962978 RepID=UPI002CC14467|nr:bifunctional diaminohydroxyphosphoribosylaminopyrimidine deaminase/5-amino-6-(5-phosphoribosylamino)uracil reductase RibD [Povalibacter sp.]HMN46709.1 bifunctional diaminohydroxyphosphoribosylaminopyrimidine deaminase/5-amino-6-(5-phosphoribosylamino)uracil reductase RibD [Povalibacter sp.]